MYGVLIVSKPSNLNAGFVRQTVVAPVEGVSRVWTRQSNGGRGPANAWFEEVPNIGPEPVIGDVVAVPLTINDHREIVEKGQPMVLFQKLLKQHSARPQTTFGDASQVLSEVMLAADVDPSSLSAYHIDGRQMRGLTPAQPVVVDVVPSTPVEAPIVSGIFHLDESPALPAGIIEEMAKWKQPAVNSAAAMAYIPPMSLVADYVARTFDGIDEIAMYDYAMRTKRNVLLEGPAGTGKTSSAMRYAALKGLPFYSISSNIGVEPSQFFGKVLPDPTTGGWTWQDGPVTDIVRHGGVLLINEVNFLPARVATVLFSLLDYRRQITLLDHKGETITASDNVLIVADMNPDYRGTSLMNEAFRDRFSIKLTFDYDIEIERQIIPSKSLLDLAMRMRSEAVQGKYEAPLSTRTLKAFCEMAQGLGFDFAIRNLVQNFHDAEERGAFQMLLDAYRTNIAEDLGVTDDAMVSAYTDETL